MRTIASQLRECADSLQEKAHNLDDDHGTAQIEDVVRSLRKHSEVLERLAGKHEPDSKLDSE